MNIIYEVNASYLQNISRFRLKKYNDIASNKILLQKILLNKNSHEIQDFCSEAYGYPASDHDWPECKYSDYKALTRLALKLFNYIKPKPNFQKLKKVPKDL